MIGTLAIGDIVEFSFANTKKIGKVKEIFNNPNNIEVTIYCIDATGGFTVSTSIHSIIRIIPEESENQVTSQSEDIQKPKRYNKRGKLECWDVILDQEMSFLEGSVLKYLWRYKEKNGVHDLEKAKVYIDKIISEIKKNETN